MRHGPRCGCDGCRQCYEPQRAAHTAKHFWKKGKPVPNWVEMDYNAKMASCTPKPVMKIAPEPSFSISGLQILLEDKAHDIIDRM